MLKPVEEKDDTAFKEEEEREISSSQTQLGVLLGEHDADQFVNPKLQEVTYSKLSLQSTTQKQQEGAHTLWNTLRTNSTKRLARETSKLQCNHVQPMAAGHNEMLKHVEKYRQRVELMHKIAHFNEAKTKQVVETIKLPSITSDVEFIVNEVNSQGKKEKSFRSQPASPPTKKHGTTSEHRADCPQGPQGIMKFVSEKDCTVSGRFRNRMERLGIDSNVGISRPEILYRGSLKNYSEPTLKFFKDLKNKPTTSGKKRRKNISKSYNWQPLTLNALTEYTCSIPAPGCGEYRSGSIDTWKPYAATSTKS